MQITKKRKIKENMESKVKKVKNSADIVKKPIDFIPEILQIIISYLPVEKKISCNFLNVSKQFYEVFYTTNHSIPFKINQMLENKNFEKNERNTKKLIIEDVMKSIKIEKSKILGIEKEIIFKDKWMKKYVNKTSPYSKETKEKIEKLLSDFHVNQYTIEELGVTEEENCIVSFKGYEFEFWSSYIRLYPKPSLWSATYKNQTLIVFDSDLNEVNNFEANVELFEKEFDLTKYEIIDLFNDMAELLVESTSGSNSSYYKELNE